MKYTTLSVKEARNSFSELIERAAFADESFIITKFGKKKAVIAPPSSFPITAEIDEAHREKKRLALIKRTAGMWKNRKDIKDTVEFAIRLRQKTSSRYEKIFS